MIKILIGPAIDPKEVIVSPSDTVKNIFRANSINVSPTAVVTFNARRLGDAELTKSLSELGVVAGDAITVTEKLASAK